MPRACATPFRSPAHEPVDWWSLVELPGSYVPPRIDRPIHAIEALGPPDLTGKTVLQIGAGDGYFAFAAERLGASRVMVLDVPSWRCPGCRDGPAQRDGFEHAKQALDSDVQGVEMEISNIAPGNIGEFDVVLFLDTLHRLRDPLPALERVARVTHERLIVETVIDMRLPRLPAAPRHRWNARGGGQARWAPNRAAVLAMLRELGFERTFVIPTKRMTSQRLRSLPAQLRTSIDILAMTPRSARPARRRDLAKSLTTQSRMVAHGLRGGRR